MSANDDNWTPAVGWTKALWQVPLRAAGALAVMWGAYWLLRGILAWLGGQIGQQIHLARLTPVALFAVIFGPIAALVLTRKLSEHTGLLGLHLIAPVCGLLVLGSILLHRLNAAIAPQYQDLSFWTLSMCTVLTAIVACARLWMDS